MATERINSRYRVVRRLGDGAQGAVYLVEDEASDGARRALKIVGALDRAERSRLTSEFSRLSGLSFPSLVAVRDLEQVSTDSSGFAEGSLFFTADYVDGLDLVEFLAGCSDSARAAAAVEIAQQLAGALAHLHAADLVHCDVKPSNILVGGDRSSPKATLLDLGLSARRRDDSGPRGTLAYMPPEALAGDADPRSDLYALGASLYHGLCGDAPFGHADTKVILRALGHRRRPRPVADVAPVPGPLAQLIDRLLCPEAGDRPSTALVVVDELDRVREALGLSRPPSQSLPPPRLSPPAVIGRDAQIAAIAGVLERLSDPVTPRVVRVCGPPGVGRRTVIESALRDQSIAAASGSGAAIEILRGSTALAALFEPGSARAELGAGAAVRAAQRALGRLAERASNRRVVVVCDEADVDPRVGALIRAAASGDPEIAAATVAIVARVDREPGDSGAESLALDVAVDPLAQSQLAEVAASMVGRPVSAAFASELSRASAGLPRFAVEILRSAAARLGLDAIDQGSIRSALGDDASPDLGELVVRRAAKLAPTHAAVLECVSVCGGVATMPMVAAALGETGADVYAAASALAGLGFVRVSGDSVELPSKMHAGAIYRALPDARKRALHRALVKWHDAQANPDPVALARHLSVAGPADRAARQCGQAAELLAAAGRGAEALDLAIRASEVATGAAASASAVLVAELANAVGDYGRAESAARRAARSRDPQRKRRASLALAQSLQKRGDLDGAEQALSKHLEDYPGDDRARGAYARLLVSRARYADAAEVAGDPDVCAGHPTNGEADRRGGDGDRRGDLGGAVTPGRALLLESAGLARLYLGDSDAADASFEALLRAALADGNASLAGRARALRGMVAQARGDIEVAARMYGEAAVESRRAGDVHAAAVCELNRATAHSERGRFGRALTALGSALVELRKLGDVAELSAALFNRGIALLALGEIDAAGAAADTALLRARGHGTPQMLLYAHLLAGDVARRRSDRPTARVQYQAALDVAAESPQKRDKVIARINLALVLAEANDARARELLALAGEDAASDDDRDRLALARARVELHLGGDLDACTAALNAARQRNRDSGRLDLAWRSDIVLARIALARGDLKQAADRARAARDIFEAMCAETPEARRHGLRSDPDARALAAVETDLRIDSAEPETPSSERPAAAGSHSSLRRLLSLSRRLNSELRLTPLLDLVIDTAIDMTAADRGFLLLSRIGGNGELDVVVARNIDHDSLEGEDVRLSRSIAERAAHTGEVVLTIDAAFDERFGAAESVAAMGLRSVLAVPLRQKGRIIGTIYVDHRFRRGAFDDDAVELSRELADIAAVAIENARLVEENQRRQEEITTLNQRLERDLGDREAELLSVKAQLADGGSDLRHAYDAIIGRSPPMVRMLETLDRATETSLPVVIFGESGTGKELVARALHQNGPRRDAAFVAINCGAVPEQLLESELFGHVRGAFTGADRERRGLFEIADGGSLFLDEVADTSLAMQAKLLRVLQEGEIRRVGDDRVRRVDVRVIAASNQRLGDLVTSGRFREDLFYRLNVLSIHAPPLRDRVEDVAALADHILAKVTGQPVRLSREALGRLCAYTWPGNVRELENELARASAVADGTIRTADLSPTIAALPSAPSDADDTDLEIKPRVEALERTLVERALEMTNGNQSAAAKLLGLSRYGLQKKLKRYGIRK